MITKKELCGGINEFTISDNGQSVSVMTLGATITKLLVRDAQGELRDVVLGFDTPDEYLVPPTPYFGATIGRVANRISRGFTLEGQFFPLCLNDNGQNCLHGGECGFDKRIWDASIAGNSVVMSYFSPSGEEGFHANLNTRVTFSFKNGTLRIEYDYEADGATPVCLTNHTYFNLNGHDSGDILGHSLELDASEFCELDGALIPILPPKNVVGTEFDFTVSRPIRTEAKDPQFAFTGLYDHAYLLDKSDFAHLVGDQSGIELWAKTTLPSVQLYSGNFLDNIKGKGGAVYNKHAGVCLETQYLPNSINNGFHLLAMCPADKPVHSETEYSFKTVRKK